ncbi:MAG: DUF1570 domain-containing protein, partial [Planctomycetota bacterium]|nr:DUF1570 domain-containing protein [Planctomycetota bacterium]
MTSVRRWQVAIAMLAVLAVVAPAVPVCAAAPAAAAPKGWPMKPETGGFLVVETAHYLIKTDMGPEAAQLFARHQEALFGELYKRMAGNKAGAVQIPRGMVQVFGSKEAYMSALGPEAKGSQGQFDPNKNQISAWGSIDATDQILETLRHEGTHQFVRQCIGAKCPLWLNEGLAEFFERAQFIGGQFQAGQAPAHLVRELQSALAEDKLLPVPEMLTITSEKWTEAVKKESREAGIEYAEAWAMVHFLQGADNNKYQGPFVQYIWHLGRGRSSKDAWDLAFGGGIAAFEKRFKEYIKDLQPTGGKSCRSNLYILASFLALYPAGAPMPADIVAYRQALLDGKIGGWIFRDNMGSKLSTADPETVKSLFRCPDDTSKGDAPSYELAPAKPDEPPGLRCRCHAGYVLELSYEKGDDGKLKPKIVSKPAGSVPPAKTAPAPKSPTSPTGA